MKSVSAILIFIVVFKIASGNASTCSIIGILPFEWDWGHIYVPGSVNDTYNGTVITYEVENIIGIHKQEASYLTAVLNGNNLTISTSLNFENVENGLDYYSSEISIKITFNCTEDTSDYLTFYVEVEDLNTHYPVFNKNAYAYDFAMDIPEDFKLTSFGIISASDIDFSNYEIIFSFEENKDFLCENEFLGDSAILTALRKIEGPYKKQFNITATDTGNPRLSTTTTVTISVKTPNLIPLLFSKNVYYGDYETLTTITTDEPIIITQGCGNNSVIQPHDYSEYFIVSLDKVNDELKISNIQKLPENLILQKILMITIEVETPGISYPGNATIIIRTGTGGNLIPLLFSKNVYYGDYEALTTITTDEPIVITQGCDENSVIQQHDYTEYFNVAYDKIKDELIINNTQKLPESLIIQKILLITIEVETPGISYAGNATIIIRTDGDFGCFTDIFGHSFNTDNLIIGFSVTGILLLLIFNVLFLSIWYRRKIKRFGFM